jgi:hypothetical protein
MNNRSNGVVMALGVIIIALLTTQVFVLRAAQKGDVVEEKVTFDTEYQAVLLSNGLAYFGTIEKMGSDYVEMSEVYYVQSGIEQKTKQPTNVLLKRGKEWHGPNRMAINMDHVVFIEPVHPDSKVAMLIDELKSKKP